ncbi:MAG: sensor histidine kinase, partial [Terrabacter sp.]
MTSRTASSASTARRSLPRRLGAVPLRWRLLGVTLGLIAVALAVTAIVVSALLRAYLLNQTEQEVEVYAASLASVEAEEFPRAGSPLPAGFTARAVNIQTGAVVPLGDVTLEPDRAALPNLTVGDPRVTSARPFRVGSVGGFGEWLAYAQVNDRGTYIVSVALPLRPLDATVSQFLLYAALIGAIALLLTALLGWYLVRRTFRPLTQIEDTAA